MTVYGQEYKPVDMSKGIFLTDQSSGIPVGYCAELINYVYDNNRKLISRPNYIRTVMQGNNAIAASAFSTALVSSASVPPDYERSAAARAFTLDPVGADTPTLLMANRIDATNFSARWYRNTEVTGTSTQNNSSFPNSVCQYRDRHYSVPISSARAERWAFVAGALTITILQTFGTDTLNTILSFRDRLFAFSNSKIYYTEISTIGGYAENFNAANNIINVPPEATVKSAIVLFDKIYIFTTNGVYQLYASGTPGGWSLQTITTDIKISSHNAVAVVKDMFVYTDTKSVFVFNGASVREIGGPIKYALNGATVNPDLTTRPAPTGYRILPYKEGFILALTYSYVSAAVWIETNNPPKYYYFDGNAWTEIVFDEGLYGNAFSKHKALLHVALNRQFKTTSDYDSNYDVVVELRETAVNVFEISTCNVKSDNSQTYIGTPSYQHSIRTADIQFRNLPTYSRLFYASAFHKNTLCVLSWDMVSEGVVHSNSSYSIADSALVDLDLKMSLRERCKTLQIHIFGTWDFAAVGGNQNLEYYPSLRMSDLGIIVNSDTRSVPDNILRS